MPQEGFSVVVTCALISITLNPLLFKTIDPVENMASGQEEALGASELPGGNESKSCQCADSDGASSSEQEVRWRL